MKHMTIERGGGSRKYPMGICEDCHENKPIMARHKCFGCYKSWQNSSARYERTVKKAAELIRKAVLAVIYQCMDCGDFYHPTAHSGNCRKCGGPGVWI